MTQDMVQHPTSKNNIHFVHASSSIIPSATKENTACLQDISDPKRPSDTIFQRSRFKRQHQRKTMMSLTRQSLFCMLVLLGLAVVAEAFAPAPSMIRTVSASSTQRAAFIVPSSSLEVSAVTLDPTALLSDIFGAFLTTPIILAVPIVAALGVSGLIAYLIVSYASPVVEDDEQ
jgi:hypothetical protein